MMRLVVQIPDSTKPGANFDVDVATEAYLNLLSPEQPAESDAYYPPMACRHPRMFLSGIQKACANLIEHRRYSARKLLDSRETHAGMTS